MPKVKPVAELSADDPDVKTHKLLLLDPDARVSRESLAEEDRQFLQNAGVDLTSFQSVFGSYSHQLAVQLSESV